MRKRKEFRFRDPREQVASVHQYPRPLTFFYEDSGGEIRWWSNQNPGDVFDIIDKEELKRRIDGAAMCGIRVVDHLPGFCSLLDKCPDHLGYY